VSCAWGCGIFLYSKVDTPARVYCRDIANDIRDIGNECGIPWESSSGWTVWNVRGAKDFAGHYTALQSQNC